MRRRVLGGCTTTRRRLLTSGLALVPGLQFCYKLALTSSRCEEAR
jgi:hypothetical protein